LPQKDELEAGQFGKMIADELPFSPRTGSASLKALAFLDTPPSGMFDLAKGKPMDGPTKRPVRS
jgi:hypothetical protein